MAFCRLAVTERRWYDGWVHGQAALAALQTAEDAENHTTILQVHLLLAICCEGRTAWEDVLQNVAIFDPETKNAEVWRLKGVAQFHLNQINEAEQSFEQLCQLSEAADGAKGLLAEMYLSVGNVEQAESCYQAGVRSTASETRTHSLTGLARIMLEQNRWKEIEPLLGNEKTSDLTEEQQFLKALMLRMKREHTAATEILSKLNQQQPTHFPISNQLALNLIESDQEVLRARALQIAESNVENYARLPDAWSTLGWIQLQLGNPAAAQRSLGNAAQLGDVSRDTAYYISQLNKRLGNLKVADEFEEMATNSTGIYFSRPPVNLPENGLPK